jgi:hypothetical protein
MAMVRIRIDDFEDGVLPPVCASSGRDGARLYASEISSKTPPWLFLLIFGGPMGIVAALVLASVLRKSANGYLPYAVEVQDRMRLRARLATRWFVGSIALLVCGLVLATAAEGFGALGAVIMGIAALSAVVAAFLYSNLPGAVGGQLDSTARWIELDPVNARFAAAYEAQEAARRAARRDEILDRDDR